MRETHARSVLKALSWRIFGTIMTMIVSYLITRKLSFSIYIGLFEFLSKMILFYLHERIWNIIPIGLLKRESRISPD